MTLVAALLSTDVYLKLFSPQSTNAYSTLESLVIMLNINLCLRYTTLKTAEIKLAENVRKARIMTGLRCFKVVPSVH